MVKILAIETATPSCSVALRIDGEIVLKSEVGSNIHSQVLLSMVQALLAQASLSPMDLDAVAVGQGPGSFTGLRIGVGVGQGLAYGAQCPMIGISSLDALALESEQDGIVLAATDARMGEVYWCEYAKKGAKLSRITDLQVGPPEKLKVKGNHENVSLVGNGWHEYYSKFPVDLVNNSVHQTSLLYPSAEALLTLAESGYEAGNTTQALDFTPIYVRNDVAKKSSKSLF